MEHESNKRVGCHARKEHGFGRGGPILLFTVFAIAVGACQPFDEGENSTETPEDLALGNGNGRYGATGDWPIGTPKEDQAPIATVSSLPALVPVLRTVKGGDVIHLTGFVHRGVYELNDRDAAKNLASLKRPVLIRSAPGQHFTLEGSLGISVPNLHWAYFEQSGVIHFRPGGDGGALARVKVSGGKLFIAGASEIQLVEWLRPNRDFGKDVLQIKPAFSAQKGTLSVPTNITIASSWIEGQDANLSIGDHSDTIQSLGMAGVFRVRNTYLGKCGNSAVIQTGREMYKGKYALFDFDTVYMSGCVIYGNGSVFEQLDQGAIYRNVVWEQVKSRMNSDVGRVPPKVVQNNTFAQQVTWQMRDKRTPSQMYSDQGNRWGAKVIPPKFTRPSWWW